MSASTVAADDIAVLKAEALILDRAARRLQSLGREGDGITVFIGSHAPSLVLLSASVSIDGSAPIRYEFSDDEADALSRGGLHTVTVLPHDASARRIHTEFALRKRNASPGDARIFIRADETITVAGGVVGVELAVSDSGFLNLFRDGSIEVRPWKPAS